MKENTTDVIEFPENAEDVLTEVVRRSPGGISATVRPADSVQSTSISRTVSMCMSLTP